MAPSTLFIDFETRSRVDLQECRRASLRRRPGHRSSMRRLRGRRRAGSSYGCRANRCRQSSSRPRGARRLDRRRAQRRLRARITQHVLMPRHGWPDIPLERWRCTMAMALACALPGKLEKVAEALELPHQKDAEGARVMRRSGEAEQPTAVGARIPSCSSGSTNIAEQDVRGRARVCSQRCRRSPRTSSCSGSSIKSSMNAAFTPTASCSRPLTASWPRARASCSPNSASSPGSISPAQVAKLDRLARRARLRGARSAEGHALARAPAQGPRRRGAPGARAPPGARRTPPPPRSKRLRAWRMDDGRVRGTLSYHGAGDRAMDRPRAPATKFQT